MREGAPPPALGVAGEGGLERKRGAKAVTLRGQQGLLKVPGSQDSGASRGLGGGAGGTGSQGSTPCGALRGTDARCQPCSSGGGWPRVSWGWGTQGSGSPPEGLPGHCGVSSQGLRCHCRMPGCALGRVTGRGALRSSPFPPARPPRPRAEGERRGLLGPRLSLRLALLSAQSAGPLRQAPASSGARTPSLPGSTVTGEVTGCPAVSLVTLSHSQPQFPHLVSQCGPGGGGPLQPDLGPSGRGAGAESLEQQQPSPGAAPSAPPSPSSPQGGSEALGPGALIEQTVESRSLFGTRAAGAEARLAGKELTVPCFIIFRCFGGDSIVWAPGPSGAGKWGTRVVEGGGRRDPGPFKGA